MRELRGRVALVSGGGEGIGRATALRLGAAGTHVGVMDLDGERAYSTAATIRENGGESTALEADVADDRAVRDAVRRLIAETDALDALVCAAGIWDERDTAAGELDPAVWERTLAVDLTGVFLCCHHALPALAASGRGAIVTVSSPVALRPEPVYAAYTAAKGGVISLTLSIAQHYAAQGVRANVLLPGAIETAMTREAFTVAEYRDRAIRHTPLGRIGTPEEVAAAAVYLVSEDASFVTGAVLPVDGGWLLAD